MLERQSSKFGWIEIGRGVAAAVVVLHHAGSIMSLPRFYGEHPLGGLFENFNVGVDFFFVLSGFIIAWVHWSDLGYRETIGSYVRKRFLRIFPPYWGVLFPLTVLYMAFPNAGSPGQHDPVNIVLSIFLLPYTSQPVLGVAWTLTHEIFFYAVFAAIILFGRKGLAILPVWAAAIVVANLSGPLDYPSSFFLSPFNLEFIMGVGAAYLLRHHTIPAPRLLAASGAAVFLALMAFATNIQDNNLVGRLAFGIPCLLFVLGVVEVERHRPLKLPRALAFFGTSSYSVYLVHPVALSFLAQIAIRVTGPDAPLVLVAIVLVVFATAAGMVYNVTVEPLLMRMARHVVTRTPSSLRADATTVRIETPK